MARDIRADESEWPWMWILLNETPFSADRGCHRDRRGAEVWMGVLRASFEVTGEGRLKRAEVQTRPLRAATWTGEPGKSSLLDDVDLAPRAGTDLLIRGHACAPRGQRARALDVGWRLGDHAATVRVHGERRWTRSEDGSRVVPGPADDFERVPLVYERAFGGFDPKSNSACDANPVGTGFSHRPEECLGEPAPQLEHPGVSLVAGRHQLEPAGFGPIAPHWQPRSGLAGTHDEAWRRERAPLPPDDYQESFTRSAPRAQQLSGFLRGGELIELFNMTPDGLMRARLPNLGVRIRAVFRGGVEDVEARLQLVRMLPDERRVELSWLGTVPCQGREHELLRAHVMCEGERPWL